MMRRLLLIEDEAAFAIGLIDRLGAEGYQVEWARSGPAGFELALRQPFDLIILDVMLPGKNGFDICRDLRRESVAAPLLMLTARGEVIDRVLGLKLGADDYVQKNCEPVELMARVEALLRRYPAASPPLSGGAFELGDVRINFASSEVTRAGQPLALSRAEFRLLKYLAEHRGALVTREQLFENVWGLEGDTLSRTVDVHIAGLRKKIEPDPRYPRFLITIKGSGYKLM
ncbi:MAG TPA: response regulator transcription factor [Bryobacteraceae bacterium]|jgi:DNA-binding response OmpR family regulator|nr:response regulator transcription factor [Bryobacteraceae bacterium]